MRLREPVIIMSASSAPGSKIAEKRFQPIDPPTVEIPVPDQVAKAPSPTKRANQPDPPSTTNERLTVLQILEKTLPLFRRPRIRILISSLSAGAVIGKAGSKISQLRQTYDARIHVSQSTDSPERVLEIVFQNVQGTGDEDVQLANEKKFASLLYELIPCVNNFGTSFAGKAIDRRAVFEVRILILATEVGRLIGQNGSTITELRSLSKAAIKIFQIDCPQSKERVVSFSGNTVNEVKLAIVDCYKLLIANKKPPTVRTGSVPVVRDDREAVVQQLYDPRNFEAAISRQYGGWAQPNNPEPPIGAVNQEYWRFGQFWMRGTGWLPPPPPYIRIRPAHQGKCHDYLMLRRGDHRL